MGADKVVPREISDAGGGIRLTETASAQTVRAARRDPVSRGPEAGQDRPGSPGGPLSTANEEAGPERPG
jgi:hypothetical protein